MHEIPTTYGLKVFIRSDDTKPAPIEMLVLDPAIRLTWAEAAPKITTKALGRDERCGEQGLPVDGIIDTLIGILLVAATAACGTLVGTGATDVAPSTLSGHVSSTSSACQAPQPYSLNATNPIRLPRYRVALHGRMEVAAVYRPSGNLLHPVGFVAPR
jgi:hypothetical protein